MSWYLSQQDGALFCDSGAKLQSSTAVLWFNFSTKLKICASIAPPSQSPETLHTIYFPNLRSRISCWFFASYLQKIVTEKKSNELKFSIKSVFGYNFRQNLAFQEFLNSNFRSVFAFHDFIEFPYSNFRFSLIFELRYSNFRQKFGFSRIFSAQNCH